MDDLEKGVYEHYKGVTSGLLSEIKNDNVVACKIIKMLITTIIIMAVLLAGTNMVWLYEWTQYDYVEYGQDGS